MKKLFVVFSSLGMILGILAPLIARYWADNSNAEMGANIGAGLYGLFGPLIAVVSFAALVMTLLITRKN